MYAIPLFRPHAKGINGDVRSLLFSFFLTSAIFFVGKAQMHIWTTYLKELHYWQVIFFSLGKQESLATEEDESVG